MPHISELSEREQDVVRELLQGKGNKQIAQALGISARTVEFHLKNIYGKYGVSSRMELVLRLGNTAGAAISTDLGRSTVDLEADRPDHGLQPSPIRGAGDPHVVADLADTIGAAMNSRRTFYLAHGVLWAGAIIAAAILGSPKELTTYLLPVLALCALYIVGPREASKAPTAG